MHSITTIEIIVVLISHKEIH